MVCKYTSSLSKTGAGKEAVAYGTVAATFGWFGKTQNFDVNMSNITELNRTQDLSREVHSIDVLQKKYAGSVSWRVQDGSFFLAAFGTVDTTGVGPYVHTFTTGDSLVPYSLYHEKKGRGAQSDILEAYTGCKTGEFKLSIKEGGYLEAENSVIGNGKETIIQQVFTSSSVVPYRFADIAGGKVTVDGNDLKLTSWEYTRNNTLSEEQEGDTIAEPCAQELVEGLALGFKFAGDSARAPFIAGTEVPVVLTLTRGTESIVITNQVVFKEHPEPTGVEGEIEVSSTADVRTTTVVVTDSNATHEY